LERTGQPEDFLQGLSPHILQKVPPQVLKSGRKRFIIVVIDRPHGRSLFSAAAPIRARFLKGLFFN
jgi:hypothetical protein